MRKDRRTASFSFILNKVIRHPSVKPKLHFILPFFQGPLALTLPTPACFFKASKVSSEVILKALGIHLEHDRRSRQCTSVNEGITHQSMKESNRFPASFSTHLSIFCEQMLQCRTMAIVGFLSRLLPNSGACPGPQRAKPSYKYTWG